LQTWITRASCSWSTKPQPAHWHAPASSLHVVAPPSASIGPAPPGPAAAAAAAASSSSAAAAAAAVAATAAAAAAAAAAAKASGGSGKVLARTAGLSDRPTRGEMRTRLAVERAAAGLGWARRTGESDALRASTGRNGVCGVGATGPAWPYGCCEQAA